MIRSSGDETSSTYSQTLNRQDKMITQNLNHFIEQKVLSGPFLVSRTGDCGCTHSAAKVPLCRLTQTPQKVLVEIDSRKVVMEVETLNVVCNNQPTDSISPENGWR
eukprot:TRINITY_DN21_c1_g1_i5.p9 TRINITY_DN21_c1_g1~~TRINITY_DN21_c1_g1_i5.p9  ORF type:complete len:106 (-),score=4.06 TRINITY_DN21_c1_g1_i5:1432-1749(-)